MGQNNYDRMLDAVATALNFDMPTNDYIEIDDLMLVPIAANDNDGAWPHLPFPDGWIASN
jgi:hypothetical protein